MVMTPGETTHDQNEAESDALTGQACNNPGRASTLGLFSFIFAALCCLAPGILTTVGLSVAATALMALPFYAHVIAQIVAVVCLGVAWWSLYPFELSTDHDYVDYVALFILLAATVYIGRSLARHILMV